VSTAKKTKTRSKNHYPHGEQKQRTIALTDPQIAQSLLGERDLNLKVFEKELSVKVSRDHQGLVISGQDSEVDLTFDALSQLYELVSRGERIFPGDMARAIKMLAGNRHLKLEELFRDQINISNRKYPIAPKTFKQKSYIDTIKEHDLTFGVGPAGTGKTYLAMAMAVSSLLNREVKRVVLCRPAVEAGEKLGFLPGDMAEKVNPYLRPLYDALHDMVDFEKATELIEKGFVEVAPLAFMRGRTLSHAVVILDEAQNTTPVQMKMFLTRLGQGSKAIVTGDITQVDLPRGATSGLVDALRILKGVEGIGVVNFTEEDVIRHPLVSRIVKAYDKKS
jgi:phosphate starvation-inducible protein PhoH and related proteins